MLFWLNGPESPHSHSKILWNVFPAVGYSISTQVCDHMSTYLWPYSIHFCIGTCTQDPVRNRPGTTLAKISSLSCSSGLNTDRIWLPLPTSGTALAQLWSPHFHLHLVSTLAVHFISSTNHIGTLCSSTVTDCCPSVSRFFVTQCCCMQQIRWAAVCTCRSTKSFYMASGAKTWTVTVDEHIHVHTCPQTHADLDTNQFIL